MLGAILIAGAVLAAPDAEGSRVRIVDSAGSLDGPRARGSEAPDWDRARLALEVENRLEVPIRDLVLDIELLEMRSGVTQGIPGWTFHGARVDVVIPPRAQASVRVDQALARQRHFPRAEDVVYEVSVSAYRVDAPSLPLALELLASPHPSDQRAALRSFERAPDWPDDFVAMLGEHLERTIRNLPAHPGPAEASKMLLAVRGLGTLERTEAVPSLLTLPERSDAEDWAKAVRELAHKILEASAADAPRLQLLPRWARRAATSLGVTARGVLAEVSRDALLRMNDAAIPALVRAARFADEAATRNRARRMLERLGRTTPRAQLAVRDHRLRLEIIRALGAVGDPSSAPALVELLDGSAETADVASQALEAIGPAALDAVVSAVGRSEDARARRVLLDLAEASPAAFRALVSREGLPRQASLDLLVVALAARRAAARRQRLEAEIADAMALGAEGAYRAALERLDAVYADDPELYAQHADPIARLYVARAEQHLRKGDYTAALAALANGRSVRALPEIAQRATDARAALARGYLELGELERVEEELSAAPLGERGDIHALRAELMRREAESALASGNLARARKRVDAARALAPGLDGIAALDRRLLLSEHLSAVALLVALGLLGLFGVAVWARRHLERRRMERWSADPA